MKFFAALPRGSGPGQIPGGGLFFNSKLLRLLLECKYAGIAVLVFSVILLGIGLITNGK